MFFIILISENLLKVHTTNNSEKRRYLRTLLSDTNHLVQLVTLACRSLLEGNIAPKINLLHCYDSIVAGNAEIVKVTHL